MIHQLHHKCVDLQAGVQQSQQEAALLVLLAVQAAWMACDQMLLMQVLVDNYCNLPSISTVSQASSAHAAHTRSQQLEPILTCAAGVLAGMLLCIVTAGGAASSQTAVKVRTRLSQLPVYSRMKASSAVPAQQQGEEPAISPTASATSCWPTQIYLMMQAPLTRARGASFTAVRAGGTGASARL